MSKLNKVKDSLEQMMRKCIALFEFKEVEYYFPRIQEEGTIWFAVKYKSFLNDKIYRLIDLINFRVEEPLLKYANSIERAEQTLLKRLNELADEGHIVKKNN